MGNYIVLQFFQKYSWRSVRRALLIWVQEQREGDLCEAREALATLLDARSSDRSPVKGRRAGGAGFKRTRRTASTRRKPAVSDLERYHPSLADSLAISPLRLVYLMSIETGGLRLS